MIVAILSRFAHRVEIYAGQQNGNFLADEPDLGVSANSITLIAYLAKRRILNLGTVRRNKILPVGRREGNKEI